MKFFSAAFTAFLQLPTTQKLALCAQLHMATNYSVREQVIIFSNGFPRFGDSHISGLRS